MVRVLSEVFKDLWFFVVGRPKKSATNTLKKTDNSFQRSSADETNKYNVLPRPILSNKQSGSSFGQIAYVINQEAICYSHPKPTFDTKIKTFLYGDKVVLSRTVKDYAQVELGLVSGWIRSDCLSENINDVFPIFKLDVVYTSQHKETIKLRLFLKDEMLAGQLGLCLQSSEFVLYILKQAGLQVTWPNMRPRLSGNWETLLKDDGSITISTEPRTGSVLECRGNKMTKSFLGYVEAVRPDLSLTLKSVGRVVKGEYRVEEFTKEQWQQWNPVFISFS